MNIETSVIESSETVERRYKSLNTFNSIIIFLEVPCIAIILYLIIREYGYFSAQVSFYVPAIHFLLFFSNYLFIFLNNFEQIKDIQTKKIGWYKTSKIDEIFKEIILDNFDDNDEKPVIYIAKDIGNNAFAINSLIVNFVKELNSIVISNELFKQLNIKEIKAIVAHEVGHFKRYMSINDRIRFVPILFNILIAYVFAVYLHSMTIISAFLLYLLCFTLVAKILNHSFNIHKKDVEYLSDLYSANKYGKINIINALIKLYQMEYVDFFLNKEISKQIMKSKHLASKDIERIKNNLKRKIGKKIHDENIIKKKVKKYFQNKTGKKKNNLSKEEIEVRNNELKEYLNHLKTFLGNKTVNWSDIDHNVNDGRIDSVEYNSLIHILKSNPELQLFSMPEPEQLLKKFASHPSLRDRILFLDKNAC